VRRPADHDAGQIVGSGADDRRGDRVALGRRSRRMLQRARREPLNLGA
jgi:hypothetical protein